MFNTAREVRLIEQRRSDLLRQAELERLAQQARAEDEAAPRSRWARLVSDLVGGGAERDNARPGAG